jgi:hypothetical protein
MVEDLMLMMPLTESIVMLVILHYLSLRQEVKVEVEVGVEVEVEVEVEEDMVEE